jgi:hypothetical protein
VEHQLGTGLDRGVADRSSAPTTSSGRSPAASSVSAPVSTPISVGRRSATKRRRRWTSLAAEGPLPRREPVDRESHADAGGAAAVEKQRVLPAEQLGRTRGHGLELHVKARSGRAECLLDARGGLHDSTDRLLLAHVERVGVEAHRGTVIDEREQFRPDGVDEGNPGVRDRLCAEGGKATADARCGVHDRRWPRGQQRLGCAAVEVHVVDDRDLARSEPARQVTGPRVDAGGSDDARQRSLDGPTSQAQPHIESRCQGGTQSRRRLADGRSSPDRQPRRKCGPLGGHNRSARAARASARAAQSAPNVRARGG